jgi:hypothetical protein
MNSPVLRRDGDRLIISCDGGIELTVDCAGGRVRGIRHAILRGKPLRSPEEAVWPEIATPDGREIDHYELLDARVEGGSVVIETRPWWRTGHRMAWEEHGGHRRISGTSWSNGAWREEAHRLTWRIRCERETIDGRDYVGFSYAYTFDCPGYAIHQLEDKATWELGGRAAGNTWIMRNAFAPSVVQLSTSGFDSGWTLPGIANPYIFQHLPLNTQLTGFTFQHDADHVLVTVPARPSHVRSWFHQDPGSDLLLHFNQHVFDLAERIETPAQRVLVATVDSDETVRRNHYLTVRDAMQGRIRAHYGVRADPVRPGGLIEDWDLRSLDHHPAILEWMHAQGLRQIFIQPLWRSNETDLVAPLGGRDPERSKRWGTLGNMCCILEPDIADCFGGWPAFERALEPARRLGLECFTWYSNCFSSMSPLVNGDPTLIARDPNGQQSRNNYGHVLFAINNASPAAEKLFMDVMRRLKAAGCTGVFRDSHFNMGSDTIDWRAGGDPPWDGGLSPDQIGRARSGGWLRPPQVRSMHDAELAQMRRAQHELGFTYFVESAGLLGIAKCGTDVRRVHGNEWLYDDMRTPCDGGSLKSAGIEPLDAYFRGMAHRLFRTPLVRPNFWPGANAHQDWYDASSMSRLNHAFLAVERGLGRRRLLPDDQGVAWTGADGAETVFAFRDFTHPLAGRAEVEEVVAGGTQSADGRLACGQQRIYRIRPQH